MSAIDAALEEHLWTGGYFCSCGHELNSPRGFNAHLWSVLKPLACEHVEGWRRLCDEEWRP